MNFFALPMAAWITAAVLPAAPLLPDGPSTAPTRASSPRTKAGPVAALQEGLAKGDLKLDFEPGHGYLRSLLRWLQTPVSSQVLVFSKTSAQVELVSPQTPRAFYFNDQVYVGWVPKSDVIEISEVDPAHGATFYTLSQRPDSPAVLKRREDCLQCHNSLKTMGRPAT